MDLKNYSAVLFVKDIEVSKEFYTGILGMIIDLDFGKNVIFKNGLTIWEIKKDNIIPSTLGIGNISNTQVNRFEIYFETGNLSEIVNTLKGNKVLFLHEMHEEPWGQRTIRFFDPDNHLIEVGESMKQFVRRFYDQGLTVEGISKRTGVPIEEIERLLRET
jgi:catechol 2,3-dioxygenase-like lactoylglutathione lyase family enzyme